MANDPSSPFKSGTKMHDRLAKLQVWDSGTSNLDGELGSCAIGLRNVYYINNDCWSSFSQYCSFLILSTMLSRTFHLQRSKRSCRDCMWPGKYHLSTTQRSSLHFHVLPVLQYIQSLMSCCSRWMKFHQSSLLQEGGHKVTNSHTALCDCELLPILSDKPNYLHLHKQTQLLISICGKLFIIVKID